MREGLEAALTYVFQELGVHRVMAAYMPHNERSARLLRSLGFEAEGYAREYLHLDGAWRDHVLTSRLRPGGCQLTVTGRPENRWLSLISTNF